MDRGSAVAARPAGSMDHRSRGTERLPGPSDLGVQRDPDNNCPQLSSTLAWTCTHARLCTRTCAPGGEICLARTSDLPRRPRAGSWGSARRELLEHPDQLKPLALRHEPSSLRRGARSGHLSSAMAGYGVKPPSSGVGLATRISVLPPTGERTSSSSSRRRVTPMSLSSAAETHFGSRQHALPQDIRGQLTARPR